MALVDSSFDTIATKADIAELRSELKIDMADLKVEMAGGFSLLRADLVRWVVTAIAFNFVAVAGLVITLIKVFGK